MTDAEISTILKKHRDWFYGNPNGVRADLRGADLREADLREADLYEADLREADLYGADLREANLYEADLRGADLREADLREADLYKADLRGADLREADLREADLYEADLYGADLREANLTNVLWNYSTSFYPLQCPEIGSFIGWKKANGRIVKLEICEDALRSSATSRKCRCSKAKVLAIENVDGTPAKETEVASNWDCFFIYKVGETVEVKDFDTNRWHECAPGIHFFITRYEAVKWN